VSEPKRKDDEMGELVPFPGAMPGPVGAAAAAEVQTAEPVLDAALSPTRSTGVPRARQLAESAVSRLPA